ncbi:hypothetical protein MIR68_003888 [Amoeboaphelidium protococcarum]|nr:hypothetical protein MIR68_003888 [Amoeboaphelidium protococcarum]
MAPNLHVPRILYLVIPIIGGYGIMKTMTPSDEQYVKSLPRERQADITKQDLQRKREGKMSQSELIGLMLKQNMESNRPAWDVRPPKLD